jgi:pimeloyl-ACP methyl ester carboxylesterase
MNFRDALGILCLILLPARTVCASQSPTAIPTPPGKLVDIGGQRLHLNCTGTGSPTVLLENGTGDVSVLWSLVQPGVSTFARVCSYDRGGYAWSEPGTRPRTFAQLALELHTALERLHIGPPYILVGQSYGGQVVRGFAARYVSEVSGVVLVDAVHEDQRVIYGGQPHRIRDSARGLEFPTPRISLDTELIALARTNPPPAPTQALEPPLDRLPLSAQQIWRWANTQSLIDLAQQAEREWSTEELAKMHNERLTKRNTLGDLPLLVLARPNGGYSDGMSISAADLENERRSLQADLALLSSRGKLIFAERSGHNIHLEDPDLVIRAIREVVDMSRRGRRS